MSCLRCDWCLKTHAHPRSNAYFADFAQTENHNIVIYELVDESSRGVSSTGRNVRKAQWKWHPIKIVYLTTCGKEHILYITKLEPKLSLWDDIETLPLKIIHVRGNLYCSSRQFYSFHWSPRSLNLRYVCSIHCKMCLPKAAKENFQTRHLRPRQ